MGCRVTVQAREGAPGDAVSPCWTERIARASARARAPETQEAIMKKLLFAFAAVLLVSAPLTAWAATMTSTSTPANSEPIPTPLTDGQPIILGHVVGATSHSVTVSTPDAERMTFEFDSRTVMPRELIEGTPVRVEFHLMPNGMHHAGRITAVERGGKDWTRLEEMRTSALEGSDSRMQAENQTPETVNANATTSNDASYGTTTTDNSTADNTTNDNTMADNTLKDENAQTTEERTELPQTASEQPWLLAFGAAAAAVAVGLSLRRRQI
jgi:LPXTG-motif cell wall-anchored protein